MTLGHQMTETKGLFDLILPWENLLQQNLTLRQHLGVSIFKKLLEKLKHLIKSRYDWRQIVRNMSDIMKPR